MTNNKTQTLLLSFVILFLLIFFFVYFPYANAKPRGIHQWAQADRLALAERFKEDRSVFNPATLSMKTDDGRVGVEFSGYQYIMAKIGKLIRPDYFPLFYRFTTYLIVFIAFFYVIHKLLKEEWVVTQAAIIGGLFCSPIFLYYSYNFLPDILAFALILVCLYLFWKDMNRYIIAILLIAGISMFIKTSSGIYIIAVYAVYFLSHIKHPKKLVLPTFLFLAIVGCIAFYDYYLVNQRNKELYSYVFLSHTRMAESWFEFKEIFKTARRFLGEYFNTAQWYLLGGLLIYAVSRVRKWAQYPHLLMLSILLSVGLLSIIILFGIQYKDHDYYVLGTFFPLILFLAAICLRSLLPYLHPRLSLVGALLFIGVSFTQGSKRYYNRMSENVWINNSVEYYKRTWLINADKKIEPYVKKDDWLYVVYVPEPNFSLIYLERKGATFNTEEMGRENDPFTWFINEQKVKFVVCPKEKVQQFEIDQPWFIQEAKLVYQDEHFHLYQRNGY
jgi:hypothetical protein